MNVTQRQDIILLPTGKREGKGKKSRWREGREGERHTERKQGSCELLIPTAPHESTAKGVSCATGVTPKRG